MFGRTDSTDGGKIFSGHPPSLKRQLLRLSQHYIVLALRKVCLQFMLRKTDLGDGKMKVDVEETDYCSSAVIVDIGREGLQNSQTQTVRERQ